MKLCIFEDRKYDNLYPLTLTRTVFELRCGATSLMDKIERSAPNVDVVYFMRDYLVEIFKERYGERCVNDLNTLKDDVLLVNGRLLTKTGDLSLEGDEEVAVKDGDVVYVRAKKGTMEKLLADSLEKTLENLKEELSVKEVDATLIEYPWDLVNNNSKAIVEDFKHIGSGIHGELHPQAVVVGDKENLYIAKTARVHPYTVIDVENGPVIIDEGSIVYPFSRIEGPTYVGKNCWILRGNIREGVSLGPVCRVGGEVEESIIHGYSNKYHTGFLGHSYVGEWVNIGALTTNSDIKNDYTSVKVYIKGEFVDTKTQKVGSFIGDHTKFSIGCLLNTGSHIGVACNLLASGEPLPKYIPSFCWYFRGRFSRGWGFRRTIKSESAMMARRKVEMTEARVKLLRRIYDETKEERETLIRMSRRRVR
ncbi:MAG: hypothetical protein AYL29_001690 [Candidatus Bathyarchaeota archaeon B24]|nr:MAG: hypothetical protein AYL29_001690 [Candidatus Bathyarchaeota archaeon B24]RLI26736.1 MAG: hypothetical protein DRO57_00430 [Candidatus Bathyarchaeota archaeon]